VCVEWACVCERDGVCVRAWAARGRRDKAAAARAFCAGEKKKDVDGSIGLRCAPATPVTTPLFLLTVYTLRSTLDTRVLVVTLTASPRSLRRYSTAVFTPRASGPDTEGGGRASSSSSTSPHRTRVGAETAVAISQGWEAGGWCEGGWRVCGYRREVRRQ
jgi:hypothetical protein